MCDRPSELRRSTKKKVTGAPPCGLTPQRLQPRPVVRKAPPRLKESQACGVWALPRNFPMTGVFCQSQGRNGNSVPHSLPRPLPPTPPTLRPSTVPDQQQGHFFFKDKRLCRVSLFEGKPGVRQQVGVKGPPSPLRTEAVGLPACVRRRIVDG